MVNYMSLEKIGERIKTLRIQYTNLSQEQFGQRLGFDKTYISRIESGKQNITIETLMKICDGIGVSLKLFFDFE